MNTQIKERLEKLMSVNLVTSIPKKSASSGKDLVRPQVSSQRL